MQYLIAALLGVVGWLFTTGDGGETETVKERIVTNLGAVAIFALGAVGVAYFWNRWRRR